MSMNPFDAELSALKGQLEEKGAKLDAFQKLLEEHSKTSQDLIEASIAKTNLGITVLADVIRLAEADYLEEVKAAKAVVKVFEDSKWDVLDWVTFVNFDRKRDAVKAASQALDRRKALQAHKAKAAELEQTRQQLAAELQAYLALKSKLDYFYEELDRQKEEYGDLHSRYADLSSRRAALDEDLGPALGEIARYEEEKRWLNAVIVTASELEDRLGSASYPWERKEIHLECERIFDGTSKPRDVLTGARKQLAAVERSLQKNQRYAEEIVKRHTLVIEAIVIDGSNMCYDADNRFIGLHALVSVANHLATRYPTTVIFDASIRRKARMDDAAIRALFSEPMVVHVMADGGKADEIVLKEAAAPNTYVISNDQFVEFKHLPVVSEDRLVRHDIINGTVYIQRLGLDIAC